MVRVPGKMIRWRDNQAGVWVSENGKASWRTLELGMAGREFAEVVRGLAENDTVIVAGEAQAKKLQPGRRVVSAR